MQAETQDFGPEAFDSAQPDAGPVVPGASPAPATPAAAPPATKTCHACQEPIPVGAWRCPRSGCGALQAWWARWLNLWRLAGLGAVATAILFAFNVDTSEKGWFVNGLQALFASPPQLQAEARFMDGELRIEAANTGSEDGSVSFASLAVTVDGREFGWSSSDRNVQWAFPEEFKGQATLAGKGEAQVFRAYPVDPYTGRRETFFDPDEASCRYSLTLLFAGDEKRIPELPEKDCSCHDACRIP